jgi:hypothetical protein
LATIRSSIQDAGYAYRYTKTIRLMRDQPPSLQFAAVAGRRFTYRVSLVPEQTVATGFTGSGPTAANYDFHIVDPSRGTGLRISADQPLARVQLWSIRPVMAIEPFVNIKIVPGQSFRWSYRYEFEVPPKDDASPSGNAP